MTLRRTTLVVTFSSSSATPSTSPSSRSSWVCMYVSTDRTEPLAMWRTFWQLMTRKASRTKLKRSSVTRAHIVPANQHSPNSTTRSLSLRQLQPSVTGSVAERSFLSVHVRSPLAGSVDPFRWSLFLLLPTVRSGVPTQWLPTLGSYSSHLSLPLTMWSVGFKYLLLL